MAILIYDYSQIEFRLIVHYTEDQDAIAAYNDDPRTDFHQWVADQCGIKRKPGKILNFAMGFGAGRKKVISMLTPDPTIIADVGKEINDMIEAGQLDPSKRSEEFNFRCNQLAAEMYSTYHERLPGIRRTAKSAQRVAQRRGYVFNLYGRRRHLDYKFARKAFNSLAQSSAADFIKECTLNVAPRYNKWVRDLDINIFAMVHDEVAFIGPKEVMMNPDVQLKLKTELESPSVEISVPILMDGGFAFTNWADASSEEPMYDDSKQQIAGPLVFDN